MKRVMVILELDKDNNAEVVFSKELIQTKEDFEDCNVVGKFCIQTDSHIIEITKITTHNKKIKGAFI